MNFSNFSRKFFIRSIATFLAALLCYESGATPIAQAAMLSQPAAIRTSPAGSSRSAQQISRSANSASFSEPFRVPASMGSTVEVFAPAKAGRLVYHLQDVHNNVPAQTNLSEIVSLLEAYAAKQNKNLVVAVEGVSGPVDSDIISRLPDQKAKEDVGAGLLRAGYMLGEEYAAITHAPGRIKIVGIETPSLYGANVAARRLSRAARKSVLSTLHETHAQLSKLIPHNFNSVLSQLEQKRVAVEDGRLSLADYAAFLKNTNAKIVVRYPNLAKMVALTSQESGIDFDKVEKEGKSLVQELMVNKSEKQVNEMLEDARALKEGRLSPLSYYSILIAQTKKDYPLVRQYVAYLRSSENIDAERLFDEVLEAESEIAKALIRHPLAAQLYEHIRWIEQQERFFSLNMIPQEWAEQKKRDARSIIVRHAAMRAFIAEQVGDLGYSFSAPSLGRQTLFSAYSGARGFYLAAEARDTAMINNLKTVIASTDKEKSLVAFIAGGFHTPGMTRQLRANGFAYEVIRPQLETEVELSGQVNFRAKKIDYLREREALAVPGVAADIAKNIEGTLPAEDLQQKLTAKQGEGTPPSSTGGTPNPTLLERANKIVEDAGDSSQPKDISWAFVAVVAVWVLLAAAVFHYAFNVLFGGKAEVVNNKGARTETPEGDKDLSVEQQKSVFKRAAELKITTLSDIAYMMQMLRQYFFSGSKDNKLKLITNRIAQNDGNFLPDSLMTPEERTSLMGIINYEDIAVASAKPSTVVDLIVNPLDGGLGENFGRLVYLQAYMPAGVKLGAKATDLRVTVRVTENGTESIHELTIAEVKLLQLIQDRQQNINTAGTDLYQPAVSDESLVSYEKLLPQPFFLDRINSSKQTTPRAYAQVLKENGIAFDGFYVQKKIPGISVETGDYGSNGAGLLQVGGHGQIGFQFFFEALRKAKEGLFGAGRSVVRVFLNGDNPNSRVNRKIVDNMVANNHVIYMLVTPAEPLDKKGGKLGVRFVDVDGKKVAVPDMMEVAQAKDAGQEKDFYALGQENGIGEAGKQSFNTNVLYINENLLGEILKDLENVLGSSYALSKAFSATRIPKDKKTVNRESYLPLDGAIGSVLLNLNAFFLTTQDERVKKILRSRGIDRLLHLVNVPRVEFFTPNKVPTDHYLFNFSDRFQFDLDSLTFKDTNPGFQQPEIVLTSKDPNNKDEKGNPKDTGFWSDLQYLISNLGNRLGARELKSLDINGKVSLANAQLRGDVKIVSQVSVTGDGSDVVDLNNAEKFPTLPRNDKGQLTLENVNVVINADRSVVVTPAAANGKPQSFSAQFPLLLAALSLGALYFTVDTSVGLSWPMLNNFGSSALLVIAVLFTATTGYLNRKVRNAPVVPENATIQSLLTNEDVDPELVQAVIDFAKVNGDLTIKVERGILADVNNKTKTLRVGTAVLTNKALLLTVLAHEQAHLSLFQLPSTYLVFRLINEVPAYLLGSSWYLLKFAFRGLPVVEKAATERSYEETGITNGVAEAGKPENEFASGSREIDFPQQKASGVTNLYIDLGNLQFSGDMADVVKSAIKMAGRVTEVSGRTVQLVVVNTGDPALESAFEALMNLDRKMGIQVRTLGSAKLPTDRTTSEGELNLPKIFEAAGFTNNVQMPVPEKNKPGNVVVFGTSEVKLPAGVKFVPVFDNFLHLALLLYTYTRYSDPDGVLKLLAGLIFSILNIEVLQNITDQNKLNELTGMMA